MDTRPQVDLRISVVIPTLNEAAHLPRTLASLGRSPALETIVIDGGSADGTLAVARAHGVDHAITAPRGRAAQLNAGAALATGDVLLFLHADTALDAGALDQLRTAMAEPRTVGGAFRMRIDSHRLALRIVAAVTNLRAHWLKLPYGDQGIFVRRPLFEALGGYRDLPIMEDYDLVRRLCRRGRLVILPAAATTSARRWQAHGVARTTLTHWSAMTLYRLGVPAAQVRRFYDRMLTPARRDGHMEAVGDARR